MSARDASLLAAYLLPGPVADPTPITAQAKAAEQLGLGSIWLSELQGPLKEAASLCGYVGGLTSTISIGSGVSHFGTRNPLVNASWGATMQAITGGRFLLGFGRSNAARLERWGIPESTLAVMEAHADILRRLWRGEIVSYDGPAGRFPELVITDGDPSGTVPAFDPPPLLLAAIGPRTLALGGRCFDGVFLHPFVSCEGVARSRAIVREAAERAGRDPDSVLVYHELVVAPDMTDDEVDYVVGARAAAYFGRPGHAEVIFAMNRWDTAQLGSLRKEIATATAAACEAGVIATGRQTLIGPGRTMPLEWKVDGAAIGNARECAARLHDFFDAGADRIILHGVTPERLGPTVSAFAQEGATV